MKKHDFYLKRAKSNKNCWHWRVYRQLRNSINCDIKKPRKCKGILESTLPSSKTSNNISSLCADDVVATSTHSIPTALNSFFVSIGKKFAKDFPDVSAKPEFNPSISSPGFFFQPITEDFVTIYIYIYLLSV